jgi:hypothetical protein
MNVSTPETSPATRLTKYLDLVNRTLNLHTKYLLSEFFEVTTTEIDSNINYKFNPKVLKEIGSHYSSLESAIRIHLSSVRDIMIDSLILPKHKEAAIFVISAHEMGHHIIAILLKNGKKIPYTNRVALENFCDFVSGLLTGIVYDGVRLNLDNGFERMFHNNSKQDFENLYRSVGRKMHEPNNYGTPDERAAYFTAGFEAKNKKHALVKMIDHLVEMSYAS